MELRDQESLRRFVREHHVHYDVENRTASDGGEEQVTGFDVRLLGTHGEAKLEAPACPRCEELLAGLQGFAAGIVASAGGESWAELVPEPAALYQSAEVRGADEVALTIRILRGAADRRTPPADDPRLKEIRERLEALGVPKRP